MSKHTPEPWSTSTDPTLIFSEYEGRNLVTARARGPDEEKPHNAQRIVACVNALAGVEDPADFLRKVCANVVDAQRGTDRYEDRCPFCWADHGETHIDECVVHECEAYLKGRDS